MCIQPAETDITIFVIYTVDNTLLPACVGDQIWHHSDEVPYSVQYYHKCYIINSLCSP